VLAIINPAGHLLFANGEIAGARAAYERALTNFEKFLPPDHPYNRITRGSLERVKQEMEKQRD